MTPLSILFLAGAITLALLFVLGACRAAGGADGRDSGGRS